MNGRHNYLVFWYTTSDGVVYSDRVWKRRRSEHDALRAARKLSRENLRVNYFVEKLDVESGETLCSWYVRDGKVVAADAVVGDGVLVS